MKSSSPTRREHPSSEEGYVLIAVLFMVAILIITMSIAAPKVAKEIQRDREIETMQRGKQYIRGIQMYYRKFNSYPPSVDAMISTNNLRFLRRKYADPTTGKEDWKPIHPGENKAPTAIGFFGQSLTGAGASAGNNISGAATAGSTFMSSSSSTSGSSSTAGTASSSDSAFSATGGTDPTSISSTGSSAVGQTYGGAGIIGFSPNSSRQSIMVYKKMGHYNEWEFVYDPLADQMRIPTAPVGGQQPGAPGFPTSSPVSK
jgi:type II secretory pathway pseudopilin PulG